MSLLEACGELSRPYPAYLNYEYEYCVLRMFIIIKYQMIPYLSNQALIPKLSR